MENPLKEGLRLKRSVPANTMIILGATGDLTRRKLVPALYSLFQQNMLPSHFRIIAFARRPKTTEGFRDELKSALIKNEDISKDTPRLDQFFNLLEYFRGDFTTKEAYQKLVSHLAEPENHFPQNHLFYLATPPSVYETIIQQLGETGLAHEDHGWSRIIIEKPFGNDLDSARQLASVVSAHFREHQVYRIDHYLGKETVQNLLVFRFANSIFEPIWNRRYVDHVQITVAENIGMEGRGKFYHKVGILRDIMQNHMMQLLSLVGMEPPSLFDANAIRDEKVKVLRAVQPLSPDDMPKHVVRGQYTAGTLWGEFMPGFHQEEGVPEDSSTETFAAMQLYVHNWRWAGVPFYLRTGKRLPKRVTEIAISFKNAPLHIFDKDEKDIPSNVLTLNIQPDEGISLKFDSKIPGSTKIIRPVTMDFRYGTSFGHKTPEAYERLLQDSMVGDPTLFTRADESDMAWEIMSPVLKNWQQQPGPLPKYKAGTWGPQEADELLERKGHHWRRL